jgi:L-asparaginase / beta-aspartyl-peptidase
MAIVTGGERGSPCVAVHGGAGAVPAERRADHVEGCRSAALAGYRVLLAGGPVVEAVQVAVRVLEDLPQFNAGTGAALTEAGDVAHDASIMRGSDLAAGAVGALAGFRNPIDVARAVLEDGRHVLMVGEGARAFARARGLSEVDPSALVTQQARDALARYLERGGTSGWAGGTVGAVAVDADGRVAAATSTGGTVGKRVGRLGDSPVVGAGTLADDEACAVSCTGDGEAILKVGLARAVASALGPSTSLDAAARAALAALERRVAGAQAGLVCVDTHGRFVWARNTETMSFAARGATLDLAGIDA